MEEQRKAWERDRVLSNKDTSYGDPFADEYDIKSLSFIYFIYLFYLFIYFICLFF
jgi:hypothetical protein